MVSSVKERIGLEIVGGSWLKNERKRVAASLGSASIYNKCPGQDLINSGGGENLMSTMRYTEKIQTWVVSPEDRVKPDGKPRKFRARPILFLRSFWVWIVGQ